MNSGLERLPLSVRHREDGSIEFRGAAPERAWTWAKWGTGLAGFLGFALFVWRDWMLELSVVGGIVAYNLARRGSARRVRFDPNRRGVELGGSEFVPAGEVEGVFVGENKPDWYHLFAGDRDYYVYLKIGTTRLVLVPCESRRAAMELADALRGVLDGTPLAPPGPRPLHRSAAALALAGVVLAVLLMYGGAPWLFRPLPPLPESISHPQEAVERVRDLRREMDAVALGERGAGALFYGPRLVQITERRDYPDVAADCPPAFSGANCVWLYVFEGDDLVYFAALVSNGIIRAGRGELPVDVRTIEPPSTFDPSARAAELRSLAIAMRGWDWWLRGPNPY